MTEDEVSMEIELILPHSFEDRHWVKRVSPLWVSQYRKKMCHVLTELLSSGLGKIRHKSQESDQIIKMGKAVWPYLNRGLKYTD